MTILSLKNVNKSFKQANIETKAINDISLEINEGELVCLIGPSGSGKTTILQIAGLLDNPSSGKVYINNIETSKATDAKRTSLRKDNIGFIYQSHHLLPEFSAIENVALPLLVKKINKNEAFKKAKEILIKIGMEDRLNFMPSQLSGGQQQRVAIARSVIARPNLILADEPTGNLDSKLSEDIFKLLKGIVNNSKRGCLMVTHNSELAKKSDRIIEIKDGKIVS
jgi:lipoprotein-releasing system ATP-binding protein